MHAESLLMLIVSALTVFYLLYTPLQPEKF